MLVLGLYVGSHYKNSKELMNFLSKQKFEDGSQKYNVTVLLWRDNTDFDKNPSVNIVRLPYDKPFDEEEISKNFR